MKPKGRADWITKEELAQQWKRDVKDIDYQIYDEKNLRLAAKVSESPIDGLYRYYPSNLGRVSDLINIFGDMEAREPGLEFYLTQYQPLEDILIPEREIIEGGLSGNLPRYVYATGFINGYTFTAEDLEKNQYFLLECYNIDVISSQTFNPRFLYLHARHFKYITNEEVARVEAENKSHGKTIAGDSKPKPASNRDKSIQDRMDELAEEYNASGKPWTKGKLSFVIYKSGEFPNLSAESIERVTIKPKI